MANAQEKVVVRYLLREEASRIEERAQKIAIEQSVETPLAAVRDATLLRDVVGQVREIEDRGDGRFAVTIALAASTIGEDADQLINMLFGNVSLYDEIRLEDAELPPSLLAVFGGPNHGLEGLRRLVGAQHRAMTCAALKPQGLGVEALADLAFRLACGGVDFIKDDHGLADQPFSPFETRLPACAEAVRKANRDTGGATRYVPSLWGDYETLDRRLSLIEEEGLAVVMLAPAVVGVANLVALKRKHARLAFLAHPSFSGGRVSPILWAKLFRIFGADAAIYPNYGGRFGYSVETCRGIVEAVKGPLGDLAASAPAPGGGLTLARIPELLGFYGRDALLLIGGDLLLAPPERTSATTRELTGAVAAFAYGSKL